MHALYSDHYFDLSWNGASQPHASQWHVRNCTLTKYLFVWTGNTGLRSSDMRRRVAGCFLAFRSKVSPSFPKSKQTASSLKIGQMRCSESRETTTNEPAYWPRTAKTSDSIYFRSYSCPTPLSAPHLWAHLSFLPEWLVCSPNMNKPDPVQRRWTLSVSPAHCAKSSARK